MRIEDILSVLEKTKIPTRHIKFNDEQSPPYLSYVETDEDTIYADGYPIYTETEYSFTLYASPEDSTTERLVDTALIGASITFDKGYTYVDTLNLLAISYTIRARKDD